MKSMGIDETAEVLDTLEGLLDDCAGGEDSSAIIRSMRDRV